MASFKNFTPHAITLNNGTVYPSEGIARVSNSFSEFNECNICNCTFGDIVGLPESNEDTIYIVSAIVLSAAKAAGRKDCVAPATGHPNCVRKDGFIVSVPGFIC